MNWFCHTGLGLGAAAAAAAADVAVQVLEDDMGWEYFVLSVV